MWAAIAPYLVKFAISLAITLLEKTGAISGLEADGVRAGTHVIEAVQSVKTYSSPSDFPQEFHQDGV
jgi:hypothetical protein